MIVHTYDNPYPPIILDFDPKILKQAKKIEKENNNIFKNMDELHHESINSQIKSHESTYLFFIENKSSYRS